MTLCTVRCVVCDGLVSQFFASAVTWFVLPTNAGCAWEIVSERD